MRLNTPIEMEFALPCALALERCKNAQTVMLRSSFWLTPILQVMFLSKMTAAVLEDLEYIVDASAVRLHTEYAWGSPI